MGWCSGSTLQQFSLCDEPTGTEVTNFDPSFFGQEDVGGLDIAMDEPFFMYVSEAEADMSKPVDDEFLGNRLFGSVYVAIQIPTLAVFRNKHEVVFGVHEALLQSDEAGMAELSQVKGFAVEAEPVSLRAFLPLVDLSSIELLARVRSKVDSAGRSFANDSEDLVAFLLHEPV